MEPRQMLAANPIDDSSLILHLDAADYDNDSIITNDPQTGGVVRRWADKSFPNQDPVSTQTSPTFVVNSTPNGSPAIRFGTSRSVMQVDDAQAFRFGTNDFTVSTMFRIAPNAPDNVHVFGNDTFAGGSTYVGFFLQRIAGKLTFATRNVVGGVGPELYMQSNASVINGQWYKVTARRQSGVLSLSFGAGNSVNVQQQESPRIDITNAGRVKVGDMDDDGVQFFSGDIASILVYNRALSSEEIQVNHSYLSHAFETGNQAPQVDAGGPYVAAPSISVQLDGSNSRDRNQSSATLDYRWDLDNDGEYGEVGASASRGDEVGPRPWFRTSGFPTGTDVTVSLQVTDSLQASSRGSTRVYFSDATSPVRSNDDLRLHLDGSDIDADGIETNNPISGTPIGVWRDQTPFGNSASSSGNLPVSLGFATPAGKPVATFGPQLTALNVAANPSLDFGVQDFSFSILFRLAPNASENVHIFGKDTFNGDHANYTGFFLQATEGRIRFGTRDKVAGTGPENYLTTAPFLMKGQWYRVTAVRKNSELSLFVDDSPRPLDRLTESQATNVTNNAPLRVGEMDLYNESWMDGDIGEVLLYNRALTSLESHRNQLYLREKYLAMNNLAPSVHAQLGIVQIDENTLAQNVVRVTDRERQNYTITSSIGDLTPLGDSAWQWSLPIGDETNFPEPVVITATDSEGAAGRTSFQILVNPINDPPILRDIADRLVDPGQRLEIQAIANDIDTPPNLLSFSLINAPLGAEIDSRTGTLLWTPTPEQGDSEYTIGILVTDSGTPNLSDSKFFTVHVTDGQPPRYPIPAGPFSGMEGSEVRLQASVMDDRAIRLWRYRWEFGDGAIAEGPSVAHTYLDSGSFTAKLHVSDRFGRSLTSETVVNISNVAPRFAIAGGTQVTVLEGGSATILVNQVTDPSPTDSMSGFTFEYDFNADGIVDAVLVEATPVTLPPALLDDGPRMINATVRVSDKDGGTSTATITYSVESVAPSILDVGNLKTTRGDVLGVTLSASDPSEADTSAGFRYECDWDADGTFEIIEFGPGGISVTNRYMTLGEQKLRYRVVDKDGVASETRETSVDVAPTGNAPIPTIRGVNAVPVGSTAAFDIIASDLDDFDIPHLLYRWTITWNDQTVASGTGTRATFVPLIPGDYALVATVVDPEGLSGIVTQTIVASSDTQFIDIFGTDDNDSILVSQLSDGKLRVRVNGSIRGLYLPDATLRIYALAGNDTVNVASSIARPIIIFGGPGDDFITGGSGDDEIHGDSGADVIVGGNGADKLFGGEGNDIFRNQSSQGAYDSYDGGEGLDTIEQNREPHRFASFLPNNSIENLSVTNPRNNARQVNTVSKLNNSLNFSGILYVNGISVLGGPGLDIRALDGDDIVVGTRGDDIIAGGGGNDSLHGMDGDDSIIGGSGDDQLYGGNGNDQIDGGSGIDLVWGELGDDTFLANLTDHLLDELVGGPGTNTLRLHPSRKPTDPIRLHRFMPANQIQQIDGGSRVLGTNSNDSLDFSAVTKWTSGKIIEASNGNDYVTAPSGLGGFDIQGGNGDDVLVGGDSDDVIDGGAGHDQIFGMQGNDTIRGGSGNNTLFGGGGTDTFFFQDIIEGRWDHEIKDFSIEDRLRFRWPVNQTLLFGSSRIAGRFVFDRATSTLILPNGKRIRLEAFSLLTQSQLSFGEWRS